MVPDPYDDVKALALDGACAYAFAVQNMLKTGYSIQQLQQPEAETHERLTFFLRNELEFQGVSGRVKFDGNTRKNPLVVQQVQHGSAKEVALVDINGNFIWLSDNGTMSDAWMIEPVPEFQEMWVVQASIISVAIIVPMCLGVFLGWRMVRKRQTQGDRGERGSQV